MENNKAYLQRLGIVSLITLLTSILTIWITKAVTGDLYERSFIILLVFEMLPNVFIMVSLAIMTQKWIPAAIATVVYLGVAVGFYFLQKKMMADREGLSLLIKLLVAFLPFIVFFMASNTKPSKMPFILAGILVLMGTLGLYQADQGLERLSDLFRTEWKLPEYVFNFLISFIGNLVHVLLLCELINYAEDKNNGLRTRIINPGNQYDKLSSTIVFWVLKTFIVLTLLGAVSMMSTFSLFFNNEYGGTSLGYLRWYYLYGIIATVLLMIAVAWYLRKFMLEFVIAHNHTSRLLYWALSLPLVGFFVWLIMLADSDRLTTFKERKTSLEGFAASSRQSIIVIFSILIGLRLLLLLANGQVAAIISVFISILLFVFLISSVSGYYFNLGLNLLLVAIFILLPFFNKRIGEEITILFPFLLLNVVQLILVLPAIHFEAFDYISYEEEKPWQPGDDLF